MIKEKTYNNINIYDDILTFLHKNLSHPFFMAIDIPFIGVDTQYPLASGESAARVHLDGAASPLVMQVAMDAICKLLPHYSNSHSHSHASARICSDAFNWSIQTILQSTGADEQYQCAFMGSGSTAWLNNIARRLASKNIEGNKDSVVLVSAMEHHANDLPHRRHSHVEHFDLIGENATQGDINLDLLEQKLQLHAGNVNYLAFSAVSNVTGIVAPIKEIAALAHKYGALSIVDCAQMAAHLPLNIAENNADFIVFSGHKVYAGASPGVMIAKKTVLEKYPSDEMGGGIVEHVGYRDVEFTQYFPARELPGTKNVLGAYALANVFSTLTETNFCLIQQHSEELWQYAFDQLNQLRNEAGEPLITIYGTSQQTRIGAMSFNLKNIDHGLAAAVLSDYFGIALRNECFCAHPYVSSLLKEELWSLDLDDIADEDQEAFINRKRGMLRASFSLYNTKENIDNLAIALSHISKNIEMYQKEYKVLAHGDYVHKTFQLNSEYFL